ncbi:unnamed protein product, partial [Pylaiella littoralis]
GGDGVFQVYRVGGVSAKAKQTRVPPTTALAAYSWGVELRKGGMREKFIATVDEADMVKAWSNGDVVINSGGKGITPATKVILNLVLGVFKVEIAEGEDEAGGSGDGGDQPKKWHIEHKSGYKQAYSEDMNMSLFPNRDWPYMKTRLNRLPTKIFLPKEHHRVLAATAEEHTHEEAEERAWGQREEPSQWRGPPPARRTSSGNSNNQNNNEYFDRDRVDSRAWETAPPTRGRQHAHRDEQRLLLSAAPPVAPPASPRTGGGGGNGNGREGFDPSSAFVAAALKEGVPPHLIQRLVKAVGLGVTAGPAGPAAGNGGGTAAPGATAAAA